MGEEDEDVEVWMRNALSNQPFQRMLRPYKFSIGAGYEPRE